MMRKIFDVLWHIPASSACVERIFKKHGRIADHRQRLGVPAAQAQLVINTMLSASNPREPVHVKNISNEKLELFLVTISRHWKATAAKDLKEGSKVLSWFKKKDTRTRLKYDLWKATLEHKFPNGTWKVVWTPKEMGPYTPFDPIEDDWLPDE